MKIVIDARELRTSTGRYMERLLHYLQELDQRNEFIVLLKPQDFKGWEPTNPRFKKVVSPYREFSFEEQLGFARQLYSLKADLVHFGMTHQPVLYFKRSVTTIHDLTTIRFRNPAKNPVIFKIKQWVYRLVILWVVHKSKRILTISEYVKQDVAGFARVNSRKIAVTYEAADKIEAAPEPRKDLAGKKFLLYVGRPTPHKNLKRLIKSFAILKLDYPDLLLVLAGRTDANYARLQLFAEKKGLHGSVVFTGYVSDGALKWLYQNAQTYVFPSLSEGFGLPGLEAMQYKLPVVSSNATCLPEIYKDAALYFDPRDSKDIAAKIRRVLEEPKLADELADKGSQLLNKYSWEQMAQQT
ncbi:MAG: glycosyltransferase family 1 protein, partial [Candidatus Saccharimonadales bacterium]